MEGVHKADVADLVGEDVRGTAYRVSHTIIGLAAFPASFIAGLLWEFISPSATFFYGSGMSFLVALLLLVLIR